MSNLYSWSNEEQQEQRQPNEEKDPDNPRAFAGGWQGLDLVGRKEEQQQQRESSTQEHSFHNDDLVNKPGLIARTCRRFPRTYNILFKVVIPLLLLIVLSFIFGAGLARLEWEGEKDANDERLSNYANLVFWVSRLSQQAETTPELCLDAYEGDLQNRTALRLHMRKCGERLVKEESVKSADLLTEYFFSEEIHSLSFDWMTCAADNVTFTDRGAQANHVIVEWTASYDSLFKEYQSQNVSVPEAHDMARSKATGSIDCETNNAAGALFWFTIMTTIGYGNTAPVTGGGRLMVYTLGFCSILVFTALIGQAGNITVTVFDDMFLRCRLKRFTKGIVSVTFWLAFLLLWMFAIAAIFIRWAKVRAKVEFPMQEAYWFTFISTTTVGLGDIFIPHELFESVDMFYIPLIFLFAFVLLATFLLKFSVMVMGWIPEKSGPSLAAILQETRSESTLGNDSKSEQQEADSQNKRMNMDPVDQSQELSNGTGSQRQQEAVSQNKNMDQGDQLQELSSGVLD